MKVLVHIDQRLIDRGNLRSMCGCPAALAITEAIGARRMEVSVSPIQAIFRDPETSMDFVKPLPPEVVKWVDIFDHSDYSGAPQAQPISFELDVPEQFVAPERRCPRCGDHMLDMRHVGFRTSGLDQGGYCYQWDAGTYTCLKPCIKERK